MFLELTTISHCQMSSCNRRDYVLIDISSASIRSKVLYSDVRHSRNIPVYSLICVIQPWMSHRKTHSWEIILRIRFSRISPNPLDMVWNIRSFWVLNLFCKKESIFVMKKLGFSLKTQSYVFFLVPNFDSSIQTYVQCSLDFFIENAGPVLEVQESWNGECRWRLSREIHFQSTPSLEKNFYF